MDYSRSANKFNTTRYYRGEIFGTRVGTYYFDVSDSVGNTTSFSITFDNAVDYTIKGNYKLINGEIWSRRPITINPGEELTLYSCVSDSGESQQMGAALEIDGRYTIDIADVAGNVVNLVVVIDTTAPSPTVTKIDGTEAAINKSINTAFTVAFNEECTVKYSNNLESNVAYTGQELNVVGKYTFIATDLLGNTMTFTVTIDNEVLFKVDGTYVVVNGVYKSRFWLQLTSDEVITAVVSESNTGIDVKLNEKINVEGEYSVTLTDDAGNSVVIYLAIDFTPAEVVIETDTAKSCKRTFPQIKRLLSKRLKKIPLSSIRKTAKLRFVFRRLLEKHKVNITFRITDNVGNVKEFTVLIDLDVVFTVKGNFVIIDGVYTSKDWLQLASDEVITAILTVSDTGIDVKLNERINVEGKYTVTLTDYAGNSTVIYLEIDFTPADAKVSTVNGDSVEMNGSTNAAFVVNSIEENAQLLYSQNNRDYKVYDGFRHRRRRFVLFQNR